MDNFTLFQTALENHKKETDSRYKKMEDHVQTMVDKVHEGALALNTIITQLQDVPHARHLAEHDWTKDRMTVDKERADFYKALRLSLASKLGWKLLVVLLFFLFAFLYHHPEFKTWILEGFLKTEIAKEVK